MKTLKSTMLNQPATEAQIRFIQLLNSERIVSEDFLNSIRELWINKQFTVGAADNIIKIMQVFPINEQKVAEHSALVGYHRIENRYFKVYRSNTGYMYVKEIIVNNGEITLTPVSPMIFRTLNKGTMVTGAKAVKIETTLKAKALIS